jgi:hypothetical protein
MRQCHQTQRSASNELPAMKHCNNSSQMQLTKDSLLAPSTGKLRTGGDEGDLCNLTTLQASTVLLEAGPDTDDSTGHPPTATMVKIDRPSQKTRLASVSEPDFCTEAGPERYPCRPSIVQPTAKLAYQKSIFESLGNKVFSQWMSFDNRRKLSHGTLSCWSLFLWNWNLHGNRCCLRGSFHA